MPTLIKLGTKLHAVPEGLFVCKTEATNQMHKWSLILAYMVISKHGAIPELKACVFILNTQKHL